MNWRLFLTILVFLTANSCCASEVVFGTIYEKSGGTSTPTTAYVSVLSTERERLTIVETDSTGKFTVEMDKLTAGTYVVRVSKFGYETYEGAATLRPDAKLPMVVTMEPSAGPPTIEYTSVPPYGSWRVPLCGRFRGVDDIFVKTITFIKVRSSWWVKPYWAWPFTAVSSNYTFAVNVTTGGIDEQATEYYTWLVTNDYQNDGHTWPPDPSTDPQVLAYTHATR